MDIVRKLIADPAQHWQRNRLLISGGSVLLYLLTFPLLYQLLWRRAVGLSLAPILVIASLYGPWSGLVATLVNLPLSYFLNRMVGDTLIGSDMGLVVTAQIVFMLCSLIVGYMRNLHVAVQHELTERKRAERELNFLATHDNLTNLPNRALFYDRLEGALARAERHSENVAVLFIDLDGFKRVNDSYGHAQGDLVLMAVAERLRHCVRNADTVSRLGGDEFTVLLVGIENRAAAELVGKRILAALSDPFRSEGREVTISASIGIALYPQHGANSHALIRNADAAMYHAKSDGKNKYYLPAAALAEAG